MIFPKFQGASEKFLILSEKLCQTCDIMQNDYANYILHVDSDLKGKKFYVQLYVLGCRMEQA